jgi:hypothetical protein
MKSWRPAIHKVQNDHSPEYAPQRLPAVGSAQGPTSALLMRVATVIPVVLMRAVQQRR